MAAAVLRTGSGAWATVATRLETASLTRSLSGATLYGLRVRGRDALGHVGMWSTELRVRPSPVQVATVNLYSAASGSARIVFERSWSTSGTHVIRIRVSGTSGHARIDLDGLVVLSPV